MIADIEGKIPDVSNLVTKTALTTVENKIPSVSSLVKRTEYHTKVTGIENKLITIIIINILLVHNLIL